MSRAHGDLDTSAGRFAFIERGAPGAPIVLCLHGFPDHPPSFVPLLERLAAAGYRAVAPWMRGYSPSVTAGPFDVEALGRDVVAMSEALSPEEPIHVVGHDWGAVATYAATAAAPHRFRRAVTLAVPHPVAFLESLRDRPSQLRRSWYVFFFQLPWMSDRIVRRDDFAFIDRLWRTWSPGFTLPADQRAELTACLDVSLPAPIDYYRAQLRPLAAVGRRLRGVRTLRGIQVPLLYLHGEDDGCIEPEAGRGQARLFAGPFREGLLEGVGHFLQLEDPDRCADRIIEWLGQS